ncbi:unnamed protein product [Lactuca virosa]|uniref:Uncharacterized protein n=1 Tax=Lactuca virosa TaxID=75947 RepID=A0AAU9LQG7_9ASTR|nr:unnamed protein product [Lactuca virosa]
MNREKKVTEATIMEGKISMYLYDCTLLGLIQPDMNSGNLGTLIVEGNSKKKEIELYLIPFLRNDSINRKKSSASWNFQSIVKSFKQVLFHLQNTCSCLSVVNHLADADIDIRSPSSEFCSSSSSLTTQSPTLPSSATTDFPLKTKTCLRFCNLL